MTLFYFVVATFPLALYWLALAWLHGRSVPCAVSGRRDFIALCLALSGVFFIGPGQLLTTWGASAVWGKYVWALLAALEQACPQAKFGYERPPEQETAVRTV